MVRRRYLVLALVMVEALAGCGGCEPGLGAARPALVVDTAGPEGVEEVEAGAHYRLAFGAVAIGASRSLTLRLRNAGAAALEIQDVRLQGVDPAAFAGKCGSSTVEAGGTTELTATFVPLQEGGATAQLSLATNDEDAPLVRVDLSGEGVRSLVDVTPLQLDFGQVVVGSSKSLPITLSSTGQVEACVELAGLSPEAARTSYTVDAGSEPQVMLPAGTQETVQVSFAPLGEGSRPASLGLRSCDGALVATVSLTGVGIESGLVVDPPALDFGDVPPGRSEALAVRFSNVGNVPVRIESAGITGVASPEGDAAFALDAAAHLPVVIEALSEQDVAVVFSPEDTDSHMAALSWQSDDARSASGSVVLTGKGGGGAISVTPAAVAFGSVALGTSLERTVVVANVGWDALTVHGFETQGDGAFALVDAPAETVLAPGDKVPVTLAYAPQAAGAATGQLVVASGDFLQPELDVALTGSAEALPPCDLEVAPPQLNFGMVAEDGQLELPITLTNPLADADCLVRDVALTPDSSPAFEVAGGEVDTVRLAPGARERVHVRFTAAGTREYTGAVTMRVSDPAQPIRTVPLTGWSVEPSVEAVPGALDFGPVGPPCGLSSRQICVTNTGSTPVTLTSVALSDGSEGFRARAALDSATGEGGASTLEPGEQACAVVDFEPAAPGSYEGALLIGVEGEPGPLVVPLDGTGAAALGDVSAANACLQGRVSTASGSYWVPGATVTTEVLDAQGETQSVEAQTDCGGFFYLAGVPAGTHTLRVATGHFSATATVDVADGVTVVEDPIQLDAETPAVAAFYAGWDYIHAKFEPFVGATNVRVLGDDWPPNPDEEPAFLSDLKEMETYDVLAFEAQSAQYAGWQPGAANIKQFVADGGTLYVSGAAYPYVESGWPEMMAFAGDTDLSYSGGFSLSVSDPVWRSCLGSDPVFGRSYVGTLADLTVRDSAVQTLVSGDVTSVTGEVWRDAPLILTFSYGLGRVIYTQLIYPWDETLLSDFDRRLLAYQMLRL